MKPAILKRTLLGYSALIFSVLICYGQDQPADPLTGIWTKSLNGRSVTFTIAADLTYQVEFIGDAEVDVYGSYEVSGSRITFTDEGGDYAAKDAPGVYAFQVEDNSLIFKEFDDPLPGRKILLLGQWSKTSGEDN
jgi:hypothetical protein